MLKWLPHLTRNVLREEFASQPVSLDLQRWCMQAVRMVGTYIIMCQVVEPCNDVTHPTLSVRHNELLDDGAGLNNVQLHAMLVPENGSVDSCHLGAHEWSAMRIRL